MSCAVNRKLLPVKFFYFNFFAAIAAFLPFIPIFFKSVGLTHIQSAIIYGVMPFIGSISRIGMGALADKYRIHKLVLIICVIIQAFGYDAMVFIPLVGFKTETSQLTVPCSIRECRNSSNGICSLSCENGSSISCETVNVSSTVFSCDINATCVSTCESRISKLDNLPIFCILFVFSLIGTMFMNAILAIQDTVTYAILGVQSHLYGNQRLWGTIGFGALAFMCGLLLDMTDSLKELKFLPAFVLHFILSIFTALSAAPYRIKNDIQCRNLVKNMLHVVAKPKVVIFLGIVFVCGTNLGSIEAFLFWFLEERLGASKMQFGISMLIQCILEIPTWFWSSYIIKKIGHNVVFMIVLITYAVRLTAYSLIENAWLAIIFDALQCINFGLMSSTAIHYGILIAPRGMEATMQSLIGAMYFGIGRGTGALIAGVIYGAAGPIVMFRSYALFTLIVGVLYFVYYCYTIKCGKAFPDEADTNAEVAEKPHADDETVHPAGEEQQMHLMKS